MSDFVNKSVRISDLRPEDAETIFSLCPGCVYWELPDEFSSTLPSEEARNLKRVWLDTHCGEHNLGKVFYLKFEAAGFVQYGPTRLYPQSLRYQAGPVSADAMLITCLYVVPANRGRGLARDLLRHAEAAGRQYGYAAVETFARRDNSNNPSGPLGLYLANGYEVLRDEREFPLVRKSLSQAVDKPGLA